MTHQCTYLSVLLLACLAIVFAGVPSYDLKQNGLIVAKLEGDVSWKVHYTSADNGTHEASFSLSGKKVDITGSQSANDTVFVATWADGEADGEDKKPLFTWWILFDKDPTGVVKLTTSILQFPVPGSPQTFFNSTWKPETKLVSNSSTAYRCSNLVSENDQHDTMLLENVRLQPFDLTNQSFSQDYICEKDRTSTTTVAPTTPSPSPKPQAVGNWTVTQADGRYTCIRLIGDIYLDLAYKTKNDQNATARVRVPTRAVVVPEKSTCNVNAETGALQSDLQTIQLKFAVRNNTWLLTVNFTNKPNLTRDEGNLTVTAYYARLDYFTDDLTFPNASSLGRRTVENVVDQKTGDGALTLFKSDLTHCYRCNSEESTPVATGFNISTQNLKVEAFLPNRTTLMGERVCLTDQQNETSDLVPIITGAALAALVVFVLIAYLVGRARAKATTYETI